MAVPKVSVLTSLYNTGASYLRQCIESVLSQTFTDFEFIILNDSPDNTEIDDIVASYADPRIRYEKNAGNIGISASRNKLLHMARGEYVAIFDHDDVCVPNRLADQVAVLDSCPAIGVVSGLMEYFDDNGNVYTPPLPEYDTEIKTILMCRCCVAHSAAMIRKSVLIDNNIEYEAYYSPSEDYRLWSRLISVTNFYNIQHILVRYRKYAGQTTNRMNVCMDRAHNAIVTDMHNRFPAYWRAMQHSDDANITIFRIRLFGRIPLLKIKNNRVLLFECIPVFKIKWR